MGDSLDAARAFIDEGQDQMETLHWTDAAPTDQIFQPRGRAADPHRLALCETLTKIQRGAKQIRARAIYLGAQDVLTAVESGQRTSLIQDRLHTLKQLLIQYEEGLTDIDQQIAASAEPEVAIKVEASETAEQGAPEIDIIGEHQTARETLAMVIPFADPKDQSALEKLAAIHDPAPQNSISMPVIADAPKTHRPLETLMRPLIDEALGEARRLEKTISVSYDMAHIEVSAAQYEALAERLPHLMFALIQRSLPSGQVGHIDLTAIGKDIVLTARGPAPGGLGHDVSVDSDGIETRVIIPLSASANINLPDAPEPIETRLDAPLEAEPKPLITPETEAELRAQLSRLLDLQAAS